MSRRTKPRSLFRVVTLVVLLSLVISFALYLYIRSIKTAQDGVSAAACGGPAGGEPPLPDTVSVAFYNVENLFDFVLDGTEYNEYKPGWFGWTEEIQRKKLDNVAQVVAAVGADIIGLAEVENMNVLRELQAHLDRMGVVYPYAAVGETPRSAVQNALLSKFPIRETRSIPVPIEIRTRSILEARIERGGDELTVFVNHWASKRNPESTRLPAAKALRERIDSLPPGADYIILGDLNSNYNEFSTFHTAGFNDTEGRTGINHVLKTIIHDPDRPYLPPRFVCKNELTTTCTDCHYNLWRELDEDKRMNYIFRGAMNTLDHILVPSSLFDDRGFSYLSGSFEVFTWDDRLMRDGVPYRWQMRFRGKERYHVGTGYSDHLPIRARLVRASVLADGADECDEPEPANCAVGRLLIDNCDVVDTSMRLGDFAVSVDGWMSGDSRFSVARDSRFARTGTHSLRVSGQHSENRTAARVRLQPQGRSRFLTMSIRGSGKLSIRMRRPDGRWEHYNAPDFQQSRSTRYHSWRAGSWTNLRLPLPPVSSPGKTDVELELRAGRDEPFLVWVDRVRLE